MAYVFTESRIGYLQIAQTDAGVTMANGSAAIPTPPNTLGQVVRAVDPTYGEGEFIMLVGVASTAVGSLVTYNATTYQTALSANTAGLGTQTQLLLAETLRVQALRNRDDATLDAGLAQLRLARAVGAL